MRALSLLFSLLGGVLLLSSLLTLFFFPLNSPLLWGKVIVGGLLLIVGLATDFSQLRRSLSQGRSLFVLSTVVTALGLALILAAAYALLDMHAIEFDLTRDRIYTLSAQTQKVLDEIDDDVQISAFYVKQAPQREVLAHMVRRYRERNPHLKLRPTDPDLHPELLQKYQIGKDSPNVIVERKQPVPNRTNQRLVRATGQVSTSNRTCKQRVSNEDDLLLREQQATTARRVPGGEEHGHDRRA